MASAMRGGGPGLTYRHKPCGDGQWTDAPISVLSGQQEGRQKSRQKWGQESVCLLLAEFLSPFYPTDQAEMGASSVTSNPLPSGRDEFYPRVTLACRHRASALARWNARSVSAGGCLVPASSKWPADRESPKRAAPSNLNDRLPPRTRTTYKRVPPKRHQNGVRPQSGPHVVP